jgi:hypothetical protein
MKSFASLEQKICAVCGETFDTGAVLMQTRWKQGSEGDLEHYTITGLDLCEEHKRLYEDGYIAIVAIDEGKSIQPHTPLTVYRLGAIAHLREAAFLQTFQGIPTRDEDNKLLPMIFCDPQVIDILEDMAKNLGGAAGDDEVDQSDAPCLCGAYDHQNMECLQEGGDTE